MFAGGYYSGMCPRAKDEKRTKKTPHHEGEDRDGVYGKENRVRYWLLRLLLYSMGIAPCCIRATSRS
ncbi:hypothetical protein B5M10_24795 [Pluralibacter gergoviae]|nr:hypothetical protein B5M10_24795 [Pluralibacter gergoviae]